MSLPTLRATRPVEVAGSTDTPLVLARLNHHWLDLRQFGNLPPHCALWRDGAQVRPAVGACGHRHVNHLVRLLDQRSLGLLMSGPGTQPFAALSGWTIRLPIPRRRLRRVARGRRWLLQRRHLFLQAPDVLRLLQNQLDQIFARQVAQAVTAVRYHRFKTSPNKDCATAYNTLDSMAIVITPCLQGHLTLAKQ